MKPFATRRSDEYSARVKSDLVGILLMFIEFSGWLAAL